MISGISWFYVYMLNDSMESLYFSKELDEWSIHVLKQQITV